MPPDLSDGRLARSRVAAAIALMYRPLNGANRWRIGAVLIDIILRLEGGAMRSQTARDLLATHHSVMVGPFSYGPCFRPGYFPPMVEIGSYTSIAAGVRVVNENHPVNSCSTHPLFYEQGKHRNLTVIGSDVWIGFDAIILPGCKRIGHGAVIGAGAVVTKDVPDYAIVAGVAAKLIGYRFDEDIRNTLIRSKWWEKSPDEAQGIFDQIVTPRILPSSKVG